MNATIAKSDSCYVAKTNSCCRFLKAKEAVLSKTHRLGLIVNPIAGMGGLVGLKGTDGDRYKQAIERGAHPLALNRAAGALATLMQQKVNFELVTCGGNMGETAARSAGLQARVVWRAAHSQTNGTDTIDAARALVAENIDLLLFAGGDGTARDLLGSIGRQIPVLGIPAGVKMHSAVFAPGPRAAGEIIASFLVVDCSQKNLRDAEVLDRDDDGASPRLFGMMKVPINELWTPHPKAGGGSSALLVGALTHGTKLATDGRVTLIGPGATMRDLKEQLGFAGTLLGIDAFQHGQLIASDVGERQILDLLDGQEGRIIISIVGGQGFMFGRGNQPFSPTVIRRVGLDQVFVITAQEKLTLLEGRPILVDTGDEALDDELAGFKSIRVGAKRCIQYQVVAASKIANDSEIYADKVEDSV